MRLHLRPPAPGAKPFIVLLILGMDLQYVLSVEKDHSFTVRYDGDVNIGKIFEWLLFRLTGCALTLPQKNKVEKRDSDD